MKRLLSLDVLRGLTIVGMIVVNSPGSWTHIFAPLSHSDWNGLTPTDLVFPFFMFIMGVSACISLRKSGYECSPKIIAKVVRRTAVLFAIGLALNWFAAGFCSLHDLRILGVMQRLAICYFFVSAVALSPLRPRMALLSALLLVAYAVLLAVGNGFDYGRSNILSRVDFAVLGESHVYNDNGIEPEGILSTIPSIAHVMIGFCVGRICLSSDDVHRKVERIFVVGSVLLFAGYLLSYGCPVNKKVWSPTFVMSTCGGASLLLALLAWAIDIRGRRRFCTPFVAFGSNPLFCYVAAESLCIALMQVRVGGVALQQLFYDNCLASVFGDNEFASLVYALLLAFLIGCAGYALYRKKIYIKI